MKSLRGLLAVAVAMAMVVGLVPGVAVAQTTYYVSSGESIQAAIDAASPGDTIRVYPGTYAESITINKQLTVESRDGPEVTIIDRGRINTTLVSITADGVTFSGFTVQNARSGIRVGSSNNTIADNVIADISYWSTEIRGTGNHLEGNIIRDQGSWGTERQPRGLFIYGAENVTARNNQLINAGLSFQDALDPLHKWLSHDIDESNTVNGKPIIYWTQRTGETVPGNAGTVWLIDCHNVTVENLDLRDTETGIYVAYGANNTIWNNTLGFGDAILCRSGGQWNIGWRGIIVRASDGNTISGNTVAKARGGIEVRNQGYGNTISGNTVSGSREGIVGYSCNATTISGNSVSDSQDGVLLWGTVKNGTIKDNFIFDNGNGIHFAHSGVFENNTVVRNNITGNGTFGVRVTGESTVDARLNWWGDASGPEHATNPDGTGDAVSDNVLFDPWLSAPFDEPTAVEATVSIHPETVNLRAQGRWMTAYIALPEGYDVDDIDIGTVQFVYGEEAVSADWGEVQDGVLMVKFDGPAVAEMLALGDAVEVFIGGKVNGVRFEGRDRIRVIDPGLGRKR